MCQVAQDCISGIPSDRQEIMSFIHKVPKLSDYWSRSELYAFELPKDEMPRNRFEFLRKFWHFANNDEAVPGNRIHKIEQLSKCLYARGENMYRRNDGSLARKA